MRKAIDPDGVFFVRTYDDARRRTDLTDALGMLVTHRWPQLIRSGWRQSSVSSSREEQAVVLNATTVLGAFFIVFRQSLPSAQFLVSASVSTKSRISTMRIDRVLGFVLGTID